MDDLGSEPRINVAHIDLAIDIDSHMPAVLCQIGSYRYIAALVFERIRRDVQKERPLESSGCRTRGTPGCGRLVFARAAPLERERRQRREGTAFNLVDRPGI